MNKIGGIGWAAVAVTLCCVGSGCANSRRSGINAASSDSRPLVVELLALDLSTCGRCTGTDRSLEASVRELRPILARTGVELRFRKTIVRTAEQAVALRFQSSPTVRINGRDVPIEFRESRCGDCAGLLGGSPCAVECRVWLWQGREYTEPPKGLIVDAILRAYPTAFEDRPPVPSEPFDLPENLKRFFAAREAAW